MKNRKECLDCESTWIGGHQECPDCGSRNIAYRSENKPINQTCCHHIGLTMQGTIVEQLPDGTWLARAEIGSIFGAAVEGECKGKGATKEEALAALAKDQHDLHESLWV